MILLTIDPVGKTAGMLSIPRDLWVSLPGFQGEYKINTAHRFGEIYQVPGGGPGLAMRTVEALLSVPVNYYARVDFKAFEDFIDELGGIEIDIPSQIKVDPIGHGNTVILEPGSQTLDGPTALAYARNRYTANDDFDRSERQQQVIMAVRGKVLQPGNLAHLVTRAPALYQKLSAGIQTNLTLQQIIKLAWLAQEIPAENIKRYQIGNDAVTYATSPAGESIYIPIPSRLQQIRDELFTSSSGQGAMTTEELIAAESVRIRLVNQTGKPDLGKKTADFLEAHGLDVSETIQSQETRQKTRLVDLVSNPYTLRALIDLLQVSPSEIYISLDLTQDVDMLVYLGEDWLQKSEIQNSIQH
jgi:LCP family protein required for cell wall assembly